MLEVGEFIRTPYFTIEKVERIDKAENNIYDDFVITDIDAYGLSWLENNKTKHSKNIIDLIEVGDYVNGHRILQRTKIKNNEMQICILKDNNCSNWRTINNKTLKSIVTKEQFASMEYRVKHSN